MVLQLINIVFKETDEVDCALCLIRSSPNLQILDINFCKGAAVQEQSKGPKSYFIEFFSSLSSIKKLNLKCDYLVFSCIDFAIVAEVSCVLCWLRSSPSLQNLEITSRTRRNSDMKPAVQFIKEQQKLKLTPGHLENVKINSFSGSRPEKEFLKLVLLSATSLTKVKLQFHSTIKPATERESRILKQLARLC